MKSLYKVLLVWATLYSLNFHVTYSFQTKLYAFQRIKSRDRISPQLFENPSIPGDTRRLIDVRGNRYGVENNSTIPTPEEVAKILGVKPTKEASAKTWQRAWRLHKKLLPLLHCMDSCRPPDSSLNLACLWWKALAGNDVSSPVFDDGLSYDLLPRGFRFLVRRRFVGFYPRLHHANVEYRTAFLDKAITTAIKEVRDSRHIDGTTRKMKVRLICFGAGYDLRTIKFLDGQKIDQAFELDLPQVVEAKSKLIGKNRLLKRRPHLAKVDMPKFIPSDLNDLSSLKTSLTKIIGGNDAQDWYNIFVFEGVMIYLNEGVPSALLKLTSCVLNEQESLGSLCFADRLENVPGGDLKLGREEMKNGGWKLDHWCPKPGLARHMGSATLIQNKHK